MQRQPTSTTLYRSPAWRYEARFDERDPEFVEIWKDGVIVEARSWTFSALASFVGCVERVLRGEVRNGDEAMERLWNHERAMKEAS